MSHEIERVDLDKVKRKVLAAAGETRVGRGRQSSLDPKRLTAARRRAGRRANALCAAIENAGGIYLPDRLHQVRIAVKKLRYAMEIARELSGSRAVARIRLLKNVQDELGRMHDLEMLIMRIRALQGSDRAPNLKLSADLDRVVRRLETECRQLHVRYMGFKQKLLQVCDHVTAALDELKGNPAAYGVLTKCLHVNSMSCDTPSRRIGAVTGPTMTSDRSPNAARRVSRKASRD
jgi:hypothetical protein